MISSKCTTAAHRVLQGLNVVMFCTNRAELKRNMSETAKEIESLSMFLFDNPAQLNVSVHPKLGRIDVGESWIRFEISSFRAFRGLVADCVFVDNLADYQNWFRDYCEAERTRKNNG